MNGRGTNSKRTSRLSGIWGIGARIGWRIETSVGWDGMGRPGNRLLLAKTSVLTPMVAVVSVSRVCVRVCVCVCVLKRQLQGDERKRERAAMRKQRKERTVQEVNKRSRRTKKKVADHLQREMFIVFGKDR